MDMESSNSFIESKIFMGTLIVLTTLGTRYVINDVPPVVNEFMQKGWVKCIIIFAILYVSTRDLKVAMFFSLVLIILFKHLLHTDSPYCILARQENNNPLDLNGDGKVSVDEIEQIEMLIKRWKAKNGGDN